MVRRRIHCSCPSGVVTHVLFSLAYFNLICNHDADGVDNITVFKKIENLMNMH
jgi:hypothetical protein